MHTTALRPLFCCFAFSIAPFVWLGSQVSSMQFMADVGAHPFVAVGMVGLLAGWVSLAMSWIALTCMRLTMRVAGSLATAALFAVIGVVLFREPDWIVSQLGLGGLVHAATLLALLWAGQVIGVQLVGPSRNADRATAPSQYPLRDLVIITVLVAILLGILRHTQPGGESGAFYVFLVLIGGCLTLVAVAALWGVLGSGHLLVRILLVCLVLPIGAYPAHFFLRWLLFPAWWYGALTTVQTICLGLLLLFFRAHGYRLAWRRGGLALRSAAA